MDLHQKSTGGCVLTNVVEKDHKQMHFKKVARTMKWVVSFETEESGNDGIAAVWEIESDHICPAFVIVFLSYYIFAFLGLKRDQNEAEDDISNQQYN